ncbi:MAG: type IX secretion system membrane protein PorP/SprF [Cyclobacteriaceae bacterium]
MKKALLVLFFGIGISGISWAQQDVQFSQYMLNPLFYNAGWAGVDGTSHIAAMHRTQWLGYSSSFDGDGGAPSSQLVSFSTPVKFKEKDFGVGVNLINDRLGPLANFSTEIAVAYHMKVKRGQLSLGIKPGFISQTVDFTQFRFNDPTDPLNVGTKESQVALNMGFGAYYTTKQYSIGLGVNHLLNPSFDFGLGSQSSEFQNKMERNFNISGEYTYKVAYNLVFKPSILFKTDLNNYSFDLSGIAVYDDKIWGGASYRDNEALILLMGYSFLDDNKMRVGYAFDYVVGEQKAKQPTSHEIYIRYNLPNISTGGKKPIRTPRFRF